MTDTPFAPVPHKQIHPGIQFLIFIGITIAALIVGSLVGIVIVIASFGMDTLNDIMTLNVGSHHAQNALWIIQLTGTTLPLLAAPVFFSYVIVREPEDYLKTTFHFPWVLILLVFVTMMMSNPLLELLGNINAKMVLPKFLKGVEEWMRKSEDDTKKLSDVMMEMKTIGSMLFDLIFIGLVTAIVEEFMFRGCLQTIFLRWMKNRHMAIWVTAILFSAFHMEFYGFLPRLLLGALFGYFTSWSGSVWPSVWAHFVNNGTVVVVTYLYQQKIISLNPDEQQTFGTSGYVISLAITVFLLIIYRDIAYRGKLYQLILHKRAAAEHGEELD